MSALSLIILVLASFRITRILVDDSITEFFRNKLLDWHANTHSVASHFFLTLFTCFWCLGWWIAGTTTLVFSLVVVDWPGIIEFGLLWAAVAGGSAIVGTTVYKLEDDGS